MVVNLPASIIVYDILKVISSKHIRFHKRFNASLWKNILLYVDDGGKALTDVVTAKTVLSPRHVES